MSTQPEITDKKSPSQVFTKKEYHKPVLRIIGDIRDLTLAPSPGTGESGNPELYSNNIEG